MAAAQAPRVQCPECEEGTHKAAVFYNEEYNNYSAYCFIHSCYIKNPYKDGEKPTVIIKTKEELEAEVQEIRKLNKPTDAYRKVPAKMLGRYGVRLGLSEEDGKTPYALFFGYTKDAVLSRWKAKLIPYKGFFAVGPREDVDPFGWEIAKKAGGRRVYITEGEMDCIALDYAMTLVQQGTKYASQKHAVISLPNGAGSVARTLKMVKDHGFEEIVLCFDGDEAGKLATKEAQKVAPDVLTVIMPTGCKDAHECVEKGLFKELFAAVRWNAKKPPIKGVIHVSDVMAKALVKPTMGLSYPMEALTQMTYGQRFGECVAIGAGVGLGKTLLAHEWSAHNITEHKETCFMVLLEEQNHDTLLNVAGKVDSIPYHKPDAEYDVDQLRTTIESLQNKLYLWEADADQYLRFDMDEIIKAIRFNVAEYGTKFVYVDNMTRLVDHLNMSDANEFINKYASELEGLSAQLDIHIDVFSHLNNTGRISHEAGGKVLASQFTGSRGLMRSFPVMMGFERNKMSKDSMSKSYLSVLKNRKYGGEGLIKTQYESRTGRLLENCWQDGDFLESNGNYKTH